MFCFRDCPSYGSVFWIVVLVVRLWHFGSGGERDRGWVSLQVGLRHTLVIGLGRIGNIPVRYRD